MMAKCQPRQFTPRRGQRPFGIHDVRCHCASAYKTFLISAFAGASGSTADPPDRHPESAGPPEGYPAAIGRWPDPSRCVRSLSCRLILSTEDDIEIMQRRIEGICAAQDIDIACLKDLLLEDCTDERDCIIAKSKGDELIFTNIYDLIADKIRAERADTVIFDGVMSFYGGREISRVQVQMFARRMAALCKKLEVTSIILAHPSLTGMSSDSGYSGSTQWHNGFRSRLYMKTAHDDDCNEIKILETRKQNYAACDQKLELIWDGCGFSPVSAELKAQNERETDVTVHSYITKLVADETAAGRHVAPPGKANNNVVAMLLKGGPLSVWSKEKIQKSVDRLERLGCLPRENYGPPSRNYVRLLPPTAIPQ
jgi:AAA domain